MNKITLWHVVAGMALIVALTSLLPGVPGARQMAADIRAGWLFNQAVEHLRQQQWAKVEAARKPGPRGPVGPQHLASAEVALKQALACRPRDPAFRSQVVRRLAEALVGQKKWVECAALLETSLAQGVSPDGPLRLALAFCYDQVGDHRRAEATYEDNLKRHPEDPTAYNDLAYHYAQRGVRLDRALELIKHALEELPTEGTFADTLGWIYYRKGWLRQAEIELVQAVQLIPPGEGQAEVLYHLGVVYAEQGRPQDAARVLSQALQLQPDFPETAELLKKMQRRHRPQGDIHV